MSGSSNYPNSPATGTSSSSLTSDPNARVRREIPIHANTNAQLLADDAEQDELDSEGMATSTRSVQLVSENRAVRKRAVSAQVAADISKFIDDYKQMPSHVKEAYKEAIRQNDIDKSNKDAKRVRIEIENMSLNQT